MGFMKPVLPLFPGESLASWLTRFALFHCGMRLPEFMTLIGLTKADIHAGNQALFDRLAGISGIPQARIKKASCERLSARKFRYNAEVFHSDFVDLNPMLFCPACLLSDIKDRQNRTQSGVGRLGWTFRPVRTCSVHKLPLLSVPDAERGEVFFGIPLGSDGRQVLEKLLEKSKPRVPSRLQNYFEDRLLEGTGPGWLDTQQIDIACKATEMLGACIEFGSGLLLSKMTEDCWDKSAQVGYDFTSRGEVGIREGLEFIYLNATNLNSQTGPQGVFGRLYKWANYRKNEKPIGPFKDIFRDYILDTMPIPAGSFLLGEAVSKPKRHSATSLANMYNLSSKTVDRALRQSGLFPEDESLAGQCRGVLAKPAEALISKLKRAIPITRIPEYIGCSELQAASLVRSGVLEPILHDLDKTTARHKGVDSRDLEYLIERMRRFGTVKQEQSEDMFEIAAVALALSIPLAAVLNLLLDQKLSRVELLSAELKFRSVLVCKKEVARSLGVEVERRGVSFFATSKELGISLETVRYLLNVKDNKGLHCLKKGGQFLYSGTMQDTIDPESLKEFKVAYCKLHQIKGWSSHDPSRIRAKLEAAGIRPVWDPKYAGAEFYRVSDL